MTAGASAGNLPLPAVLCLPILFAAGMTLMDTTDGVLMSQGLQLGVPQSAAQDLLQHHDHRPFDRRRAGDRHHRAHAGADPHARPHGRLFDSVAGLDFGVLGYLIVGLFLLAWALSVALWKLGRIEERYGRPYGMHMHAHRHPDGTQHSHEHVH